MEEPVTKMCSQSSAQILTPHIDISDQSDRDRMAEELESRA